MTKNLKKSYLLSVIFSCIMIAWRTLANFFGGSGINFVSLIIIIGMLAFFMIKEKYVWKRIKDIYVLICVFSLMEFLIYIINDLVIEVNFDVIKGFMQFQTFLSVMGLLFLAYIFFRFIMEEKGVKLSFIERILGNKVQKKVKTNKELANGTLEEKPNHTEAKEEMVDKQIDENEE